MFINEWTWLFDFLFVTPPTRNYLMRQYDMIGFPRNEHFSGRLFPNRSRGGGRKREWARDRVLVVCNERPKKHWKKSNWVRHCPTAISTLMKVKWRIFLSIELWVFFAAASLIYGCALIIIINIVVVVVAIMGHSRWPLCLSTNINVILTFIHKTLQIQCIHTYLFSKHVHLFLFVFEKEMSNESTEKICVDCVLEQLNILHWWECMHTYNAQHTLPLALCVCLFCSSECLLHHFVRSFIECASMILDGHSLENLYVSRSLEMDVRVC